MDRKPKPLTDEQVAKRLEDLRAWRQRNRTVARKAALRSGGRNDAAWRQACVEAYGARCVVCGDPNIEMDHLIPRSQGGASVVENGLPLCGAWSRTVDGGHHGAKTAGLLFVRYSWLTSAQIEFLADQGWVVWDKRGRTSGRGFKHFAPRLPGESPRG